MLLKEEQGTNVDTELKKKIGSTSNGLNDRKEQHKFQKVILYRYRYMKQILQLFAKKIGRKSNSKIAFFQVVF